MTVHRAMPLTQFCQSVYCDKQPQQALSWVLSGFPLGQQVSSQSSVMCLRSLGREGVRSPMLSHKGMLSTARCQREMVRRSVGVVAYSVQ